MLEHSYHHEIHQGIHDGTIQRRDGEILNSSSKELLIQTYRARAINLERRTTAYASRLRGEITELLSQLELTSEQEFELVIFDVLNTAKSYLVFRGKKSQQTLGILYVEAQNQ